MLDCASSLPGRAEVPNPGDFTLCINCSKWLRFDDKLVVRKPTESEMFEARMKIGGEMDQVERALKAAKRE
jgi:hypothetical protein